MRLLLLLLRLSAPELEWGLRLSNSLFERGGNECRLGCESFGWLTDYDDIMRSCLALQSCLGERPKPRDSTCKSIIEQEFLKSETKISWTFI